jgi:hypothetical protein
VGRGFKMRKSTLIYGQAENRTDCDLRCIKPQILVACSLRKDVILLYNLKISLSFNEIKIMHLFLVL